MVKNIIKESIALRSAIADRMAELNLNYSDVIRLTEKGPLPINYGQFLAFMKTDDIGNFIVTDKQVPKESSLIWLATRLGIHLDFRVKTPKYEDRVVELRLKRLSSGRLIITHRNYD